MEFVKAKTILSKVKYGSDWYGIDYNMNLYRGCSHGCIYCDSRSNCYHIDNFDIPKGKVFVMGDNRNHSLDSRKLGYFDFDNDVIGKVFFKIPL